MDVISYDPGCAGWVRAGVPDREQFHPHGAGWGFPLKCSLIRRGQPNKPQTCQFQPSLAEVLAQEPKIRAVQNTTFFGMGAFP